MTNRMIIQIVSDLHCEFYKPDHNLDFITPSAPILALVGDNCCCAEEKDFEIYKKLVNRLLPKYQLILMIAGNHEYFYNGMKTKVSYANTIDGVNDKLSAFAKTSPKLKYLNNSSIKVTFGNKKYLIAGSTLWTNIPEDKHSEIADMMNDYNFIYVSPKRNLHPSDVLEMHKKNVKYIKSQIKKAKDDGYQLIILTHHKPFKSNDHGSKVTDYAYESDLSMLFGPPVVLWGYGHTHVPFNKVINKTLLYSNPKGYMYQKTNYSKNAVIKL